MSAVERERARAGPVGDRELVAEMAGGDAEALGALYDRHSPLLRALVFRILPSTAEAEDLVHDVFLEAWQHAAEYDPARGTVRAWLVLRARSRALDRVRSAPVARTVSAAADQLERAVRDEGDATLAPDQARVRRVLAELPEGQRLVLLLGYFEGLSSSEIAERIGIPIGTVKSRTAAALSRLRSALREGGQP